MKHYSLTHLADHVLLRGLRELVARDRETTAELLAHLAEVDERKLYLPAAYSSMFAYCVGELRFSEDATYKRTQAARAARRFPAIFTAVAEGRLHLSAVVLLAPHLTAENAAELLAAATHKPKSQIEQLLAERVPKPDVSTLVKAIAPVATAVSPAPGQVKLRAQEGTDALDLAPASPSSPAPAQAESAAPRAKVTPLAPQRFSWQLTVTASTNDKLQYARQLLGHAVPGGEVAEVLDRALDALIVQLEKRVFAASSRPRPGRRSANARQVPAEVMRKVWARDGGRCTFVSDKGHRCEARTRLEFDHVLPVARGGRSTVDGLRLLCRAHNQHAADCTFGKGFMHEKREAARHRTQEARARRGAAAEAARPGDRASTEALSAAAQELVPWLREMGCRPCDALGDVP